jgi:Zn finger protein HypA/HybF involved in hydrogenase expression
MTMTAEHARRVAEVWTRNPDLTEVEVHELVDAQLEAEALEHAERQAHATEMTESMAAFWSCRACNADIAPGVRDGYCDRCRSAAFVLTGLAALDDDLGGHTRRALIEADLARRS